MKANKGQVKWVNQSNILWYDKHEVKIGTETKQSAERGGKHYI